MIRTLIAIAAVSAALLAGIGPARAASDLHVAMLHASDAPKGYSAPKTKFFSHYAPHLRIKLGKNGSASCDAQPQLKSGWKQAMLQYFGGPNFLSVFEVCGYLDTSTGQTHAAYLADVASSKRQAKATPGLTSSSAAIGNEALQVSGSKGGFATYEIIFRRDNALIEMVYLGNATYKMSQMLATAHVIDSRLKG